MAEIFLTKPIMIKNKPRPFFHMVKKKGKDNYIISTAITHLPDTLEEKINLQWEKTSFGDDEIRELVKSGDMKKLSKVV